MRLGRLGMLAGLTCLLVPSLLPAQLQMQKCMICHGKRDFRKILDSGEVRSLYVDLNMLQKSVHAKRICVDCHSDVVEIPHAEPPKRVSCTRCHYKGNPEGAPQTDAYLDYAQSVHAIEVAKGNPKAPVCQSCHGTHDIQHPKKPGSRVFRAAVAATCGSCHLDEFAQYRGSIHGTAVAHGNPDAPTCTSCHGEHRVLAPADPSSTVAPAHVSATCSTCHAAVGIVGKYGIDVEQVATYQESFHGVATKFGSRTVANCSSCHMTHDIRPPADPLSSVNVRNIPATCGHTGCHEGANANYAKGKIHVDPERPEAGIIYYVAAFFKYLTITVMIGLALHIALDFNRKLQALRKGGHE
ncbi:MAG: hypothetical protein HYX75_02345 [Acidobacteria bacterium]|nr:hypothetical protein [Acidobacteriota bacterium]